RMARTSSSRRIRYSWPSILMSVPAYFPKRTRSPAFTSRGTLLPLSRILPLPTAMTSPSCGFSLAVSGMMIPPLTVSFSSTRRTSRRSCSGRTLLPKSGLLSVRSLRFVGGCGCTSRAGRRFGTHPYRVPNIRPEAWRCQAGSASGGRPPGGGPAARLQLVFLDLLAERVAVHAEVEGGLRHVAPVVLEHAGDEPLLELAPRLGEEDPLLHHLRDQGIELLLHGLAPFGAGSCRHLT